jgi:hypothetical protein
MSSFNFVDAIKIIGFLLVVSATFIATVVVPKLDKEISAIDDEILSFKDSRIMTTLAMLSYGEQFTRRRIELFEANQFILLKNDKKAAEEIRKRALNQTIDLAKQWAYLHGGRDAESLREKTEEKIKVILDDNSLDVSNKLDAVEKIWKENQVVASERIAQAHKEWHDNEDKMKQLMSNSKWWTRLFAWLQILGLILFSGAEVFDKLIKS